MEETLVFLLALVIAFFVLYFANSIKKLGANKFVVEILYWFAGMIFASGIMVWISELMG
uniref:hypothetical protein n=1 Tax=Alistipes sp. TaxID=1872444 RepID=UPI0040569D72